jgi:hypothetical protein
MKHIGIIWLVILLGGCAPSAVSIFERNRLAAQAEVTADTNAADISAYIIANEEARLNAANTAKQSEFRLRWSVAQSAEEGAALMASFTTGLAANREAFEREVSRQLVMAERQRLTGRAAVAINTMADKEATAARRAFDEFVKTELPRIMAEAQAGLVEIQRFQEAERIREEAARAQAEADRQAREAAEEEEHVEPEPEPTPAPVPVPTPTPTEVIE